MPTERISLFIRCHNICDCKTCRRERSLLAIATPEQRKMARKIEKEARQIPGINDMSETQQRAEIAKIHRKLRGDQ